MEIDQLLNLIIEDKLGKDFEAKVEKELDNILAQEKCKINDDIKKLRDDILIQYRKVLDLLHIKAPRTVKISADDLTTFVIDEKAYDLNACFSHNDLQATECTIAIEALFSDLRSVSENIGQDIAYIENKLVVK